MLGSDQGIKIGSMDGKVIGTILEDAYVITIGIDVGTDLGNLYVSFDGSNDGKLERLLHGYSLVSTASK